MALKQNANLRRLFCAMALLFSAPCDAASQHKTKASKVEHSSARRRARALTHGVNLSGWFGGSGDYSEQHLRTYRALANFDLMKSVGIQYVRLPIDPQIFSQTGSGTPWTDIDGAVEAALSHGMAVDIVLFPNDQYKSHLKDGKGILAFVETWKELARHFSGRDPNQLFYELMNESELPDTHQWIAIQAQAVSAIRAIDPNRTILVSGPNYDGVDDLAKVKPIHDTNIIYTFHFYEPYPFTHQGASWGSSEWLDYKSLPYPATSSELNQIGSELPSDTSHGQLDAYRGSGWNRALLDARISKLSQWANTHHVPLVCTEFGAFRDTIATPDRVRYLNDVASILDRRNIGWAIWDWNGNFGIVFPEGNAILDSLTVFHRQKKPERGLP